MNKTCSIVSILVSFFVSENKRDLNNQSMNDICRGKLKLVLTFVKEK